MCDPVTAAIIVGATAVAGTTASVVGQIQSANAQTKAINEQRAVVREETRQEATGELFDQMRVSRREQAQIRTAAGEAGLGLNSGSIEGLLLDSAMQGELQGSRTIANMESKHRSTEAEANSMLSRISKPTPLGAGLQIASSAASAWSGIKDAKIKAQARKSD
ncbi:virion core protein, T7 gp14 family [Sphingomonas endophytica]|uniref:Internal virion protein n=1 Tax=Sphingomonas endophytica TaxID=869719 RepID=A0A147I9Z0_9SPHN|nr:hypothetical protein [Sphingomonas endophytica]KTT76671.1 hypothetical protein NS334_00140 [Sphingomonas endophytica]